MSDGQPPFIPTHIPSNTYFDLYSLNYGKKVVDIVPIDGQPGKSTIKFADGSESTAWVAPPKTR